MTTLRRILPLLPWLWLGLMLVLFLMPGGPDAQPPPPGLDKLVHAGLFAVWIGLWLRCSAIAGWVVMATAVAVAIGTEIVQDAWVPRREGDVLDFTADIFGALIGLMCSRALKGRGDSREKSTETHVNHEGK